LPASPVLPCEVQYMELTEEQVSWCLEGRIWGRAEALLYLTMLQQQQPDQPLSLRKLAACYGWSHTQVSRYLEFITARGWLPLEQQQGSWVWTKPAKKAKPAKEPVEQPEPIPVQIVKVEPVGLAAELTEGLPRIRRMKQQLTEEQAKQLVATYGLPAVRATLESMENYAKLGNYISTHKTANNWLRRANTNGTSDNRAAAASLTNIANRAAEYDAINTAAQRSSSKP